MKKIDRKITCIELLNKAESIRNKLIRNYVNNNIEDNEKSKEFEVLQKKVLMAAVEEATTPEDLELCAVCVETIYCGDDIDVDEWAEQIRIKAYGLNWYLSKYFSSVEYKEFVMFTKNTKMVNPFENLI